jgi:hypothetical protein
VRRTLLHPRVAGRYGLKADEVEAFVGRLREEAVSFDDPVDPPRVVPDDPPRVVPDDPNDDYLIALALSSGAEFLVTRDRHFDNVRVQGVKIRTPGRCCASPGPARPNPVRR